MRRAPNEPLSGAPDPWAPSSMPAFRGKPPYAMSEMIAAEPALSERLVRRLSDDPEVEALVTSIRENVAAGRPVITTGCGTSEHAAMAIAAMLNEALALPLGRDVRALPALDAVVRPPAEGLLIAVSHEGGTEITNRALLGAPDAAVRTALITVGGGSPGAQVADIVARTEEHDQSWCHTVGYLSPLLVGWVVAARAAKKKVDPLAMRSLLDGASDSRAAASAASRLLGVDRLITVGSGADYVSARELALKVSEGARLPVTALETETLLHGHLAAATRWTGIVLLLTTGDATATERGARALNAAEALDVPTVAILSADAAAALPNEVLLDGRVVLPRNGRVSGAAGSLLSATPAIQLLAERLARARGVNPDTLGREDPAQAAAHA